jgi:hypothetical protein
MMVRPYLTAGTGQIDDSVGLTHSKQSRQPRDVDGDPSRLIGGQHLSYLSRLVSVDLGMGR